MGFGHRAEIQRGYPDELEREPPAPDFKLRPLQAEIKADKSRFKVACIHRRFGKTVLAVDYLKTAMLECTRPSPRGYFIFPFAKQGEEIAWSFLLAQTSEIEGMSYDRYRLECTFPNDARIKLLGAEVYNKHRGKYADCVVLDEVSDISPAAWRQVFRPMLSDRKGSALFIGTPRGRDWFKDLWDNGDGKNALPGWRSWHATVYDTDSIEPDEIEALKREMLPNEFAREYLCDWEISSGGAFYQHQFNAMIDDDRVGEVPHIPDKPVHTAWFMDGTDSVTVTFWQQRGAMMHCIDDIRVMNQSIPDVVQELYAKPYIYGRHHAPASLAIGPGRWKTAKDLGITLLPNRDDLTSIDTIEITKNRLGSVRMDAEHAADMIEAGRQYHADFDEKRQAFKNEGVRDWSMEYCSSMSVMMLGHNERATDWSQPIVYPEQFRG